MTCQSKTRKVKSQSRDYSRTAVAKERTKNRKAARRVKRQGR